MRIRICLNKNQKLIEIALSKNKQQKNLRHCKLATLKVYKWVRYFIYITLLLPLHRKMSWKEIKVNYSKNEEV